MDAREEGVDVRDGFDGEKGREEDGEDGEEGEDLVRGGEGFGL